MIVREEIPLPVFVQSTMKFFALLGIFAMAQIVEVSVGVKTVLCYLDLSDSYIAAVVAHTLDRKSVV